MTREAALKAWRTRRHGRPAKRYSFKSKTRTKKRTARRRMPKGKRIRIHSPNIRVNGHAQTTYAPPKKWWDNMTKKPHGAARQPLSRAAAGHLWFKTYNNDKRLQIIRQYG